MGGRTVSRTTVAAWVAGALAVAACLWLLRGAALVSCEACVSFRGAEACASASARSRELASRGATDGACALVGKGLAERMQCGANPPTRVTCRQR